MACVRNSGVWNRGVPLYVPVGADVRRYVHASVVCTGVRRYVHASVVCMGVRRYVHASVVCMGVY